MPDNVWNHLMGYINMFWRGISSSWEDYSQKRDSLWIHHFAILHLIHPFFKSLNQEKVMFLHGNHVRMIRHTGQKDKEDYSRKYQCKPSYWFVWLCAFSGLDEDKELDYVNDLHRPFYLVG